MRPFGTDDRAEQPTAESERAAASYVDWSSSPPSQRPLAAQRPLLATILFGVLKDHRVSRLRFADMIGVNEKQVRKMLDGRAPIPLASLGVMPVDMAIDFMDRIAIQRGVRRSFDAEVARMDLVTAIAAQGRLQAHVAKLAAGRGGR